jgi:hypothetical protein
VREMFKHEDFQFGYEIALGGAYRGYTEVGEVLATAGRIKDGDADEWVREWTATAERLEAAAREADAAGRRVSARGLFLQGLPFRHDWEAVPAGRRGRRLTTPLLITEPEDEQFWPGQSQALYDRLPGPKQLVKFTAAQGANRHCEPMGLATRDTRIFDWLDRYLAG